MTKKIAILIKGNVEEGLRMAVGATMLDDEIHVYILDKKVDKSDKNALNLETIDDLEMPLFTNKADNSDIAQISTEKIVKKLVTYDHVIVY